MTQTVHKIKDNNEIEIYYHPNNPKSSWNDSRLRYKYSAILEQVQASEALNWLLEEIQYEDGEERREELINHLKNQLPKINKGKVWRISLNKSEQEIEDLHATKQDAVDYVLMNCRV